MLTGKAMALHGYIPLLPPLCLSSLVIPAPCYHCLPTLSGCQVGPVFSSQTHLPTASWSPTSSAPCTCGRHMAPAISSQPGLMLSQAAQPIPRKLVNKIRAGQFVEMWELLADNMALMIHYTYYTIPHPAGSHKAMPA